MGRTISFRFKDTPEDQQFAQQIMEALRGNVKKDNPNAEGGDTQVDDQTVDTSLADRLGGSTLDQAD